MLESIEENNFLRNIDTNNNFMYFMLYIVFIDTVNYIAF